MSRPFNEFSYSLSQAAELLNADVKNAEEISFTGLTHVDSEVQAGDIFLAFPGAKVHGAQFIESAISHGAVAVLTDAEGAAKSSLLPTLIVKDVREAGAVLASSFYRLPMRDMQSIGITGTNGKTTTVELTAAMLRSGGFQAVACGNVGTTVIETVDSIEKHDYLVLELSSFQLHWLEDAQFVSAAVLNIAEDHIDWHGSLDEYANAKLKLLWIACGEKDFLLERNNQLITTLKERSVNHEWHLTPGDHSWPIWRDYLIEFAPKLFH